MLKRRAMAAAVAAAVGDHIPAPVSSSCLDILPKTGQGVKRVRLESSWYGTGTGDG